MAATSDLIITLLTIALLVIAASITLTILALVWRDRRPQHQADALENAAIQRYVHHSVWV